MCGIADNIRRARNAKGLTLAAVTNELDRYGISITPSMLSALEKGERRLAAQTVLALSEIYGVSVQELYGIEERRVYTHNLNEHELEIVDYIETCWGGDRDALIQFVGMYVAADRDTRAEIAGTSLRIYRDARNAGMRVNVPYEVRTHFISKKWGELLE